MASNAREFAAGGAGGFKKKDLTTDKVLDAESLYLLGDESSIGDSTTITVPVDSKIEVSIYNQQKSL